MDNPFSSTSKALSQAIFLISFPFGILSFVLPIYGKQLGASALEIGGFFSAVSFVPILVRPFLGRALDRWGRKPFFILGLAGYAVAMVTFCFANTVWLLTLARFMQGLGQAFFWLSALTIMADIARERGHEFGKVDEATNRGALIGTTAGFFFIFYLQDKGFEPARVWFWLFCAYTIPTIIAFIVGWSKIAETRPITSIVIENKKISTQLLTLMGIVFVTGASMTMVWPLLMVFLQDALHAQIDDLALAYVPAALIGAFLPSRMGRIADRIGRKIPMVIGLIVGAFASFLIPHLPNIIALAALWAIESMSYAAAAPAERAFVADIAGTDARGTNYGLYTFAYFLGAAVGPIAGGFLYDNWGHATPFYLNGVVLLVGAMLVATILRESHRSEGMKGIMNR
jgi:MFS family permease